MVNTLRSCGKTLAVAALSLIAWHCQSNDTGETVRTLELVLPDSLKEFDPLVVTMSRKGKAVPDTLWKGPLASNTLKVQVPGYDGGAMDLRLRGMSHGILVYSMLVHFIKEGVKPEMVDEMPPDLSPPSLVWTGPDTVYLVRWDWKHPSPALFASVNCVDDRDGARSKPILANLYRYDEDGGKYHGNFACRDRSGNLSSGMQAEVVFVSFTDTIPPVLTLPDSEITVIRRQPVPDKGITCVDDQDGTFQPTHTKFNSDVAGSTLVEFTCRDSSMNSVKASRMVRVMNDPAALPPHIHMYGPDTVPSMEDNPWIISPYCLSGDSTELLEVSTRHSESGPWDIVYTYSCSNEAGRIDSVKRVVKGGVQGGFRYRFPETLIDTLAPGVNHGGTGAIPFHSGGKNERNFPLLRFGAFGPDSAKCAKAYLYLYAFAYGAGFPSGPREYTFSINAVAGDWEEGNGDPFYYDGNYHNGGEKWYANFDRRDGPYQALYSDPRSGSGVGGEFKEWLRPGMTLPVSSQKVKLDFGTAGDGTRIPLWEHMVLVKLDVTEYVKSLGTSQDHGFTIQVDGVPEGGTIAFATQDLPWSPPLPGLILEY